MKSYIKQSLIYFFIISINACQEGKDLIIIKGNVANLNAKKIYLTDAYNWQMFIDSAICKDGKFQFNLNGQTYTPSLASLCFQNERNEIEQLRLINYKRTNGKDTFANTGFMLSFGINEISGNYYEQYHRLSIKPNRENDLLFDPKTESFGSYKNMSFIEETIKKYPQSYFLLQRIHQNKNIYSKAELNKILSLFSRKLLQSHIALEIELYAGYLNENGELLPSLFLNQQNGDRIELFHETAQLYMLIFWASWCGPCRMEIPQLKAIFRENDKHKVIMKSISIDEDFSKWEQALKNENMAWEQLLIPGKEMLKIKAQFHIDAVPTVVFVDSNKKILKRITGFDAKNIEQYKAFISQYLLSVN